MRRGMSWPGGKRFAFTIFDDCDNSTVANTKPFYDLLEQLGMRSTKTVWTFSSANAPRVWQGATTLEDPASRDFAVDLQTRGFEIASHGASMVSSTRDETLRALQVFERTFGGYPRSYANHGGNRENVYWFDRRFRSRLLRRVYAWNAANDGLRSEGHVADSPYFWGDLCLKHMEYVRGFTFPRLDLFSVHRNIVYRDPLTPFVNFWFSACHAPDVETFNALLASASQDDLERRGGVSIVATHVGPGFVRDGVVHRTTRALLESLAARNGWFVPVSTLLDHVRARMGDRPIGRLERRIIELRWAAAALRRGRGR